MTGIIENNMGGKHKKFLFFIDKRGAMRVAT